MKNEKLIKELIKKDYEIPLSRFEKIVYIMNKNDCKTIKDWDEVNSYIEKYTEKTKEHHHTWKFEYSIDIYYEYLKEYDKTSAPLQPKEDIYYLVENMKQLKKIKNENFEKEMQIAFQKINDEYTKNFMA